MATKLLETILKKAREPTSLADLARYHQHQHQHRSSSLDGDEGRQARAAVLIPPECYEEEEEVMKKRKEWLRSVGKGDVWERLEEAVRGASGT